MADLQRPLSKRTLAGSFCLSTKRPVRFTFFDYQLLQQFVKLGLYIRIKRLVVLSSFPPGYGVVCSHARNIS